MQIAGRLRGKHRGDMDNMLLSVDALCEAIQSDNAHELWPEWQRHLREYNQLSRAARALSVDLSPTPIAYLPPRDRSSAPSHPQKAKMHEILRNAQRLSAAIRNLCDGARELKRHKSAISRKQLAEIIRRTQYFLTDKTLFPDVPKNERDVHMRVEGVLKCVFPDLNHKPTLTKQIKNFEPDTGIPSMETLIEYKFLSRAEDVSMIADQVLADTRGYVSNGWSRFIYVIYETNRFRPEDQWIRFLKESGVPKTTAILVISGEPGRKGTRKAKAIPSGKVLGSG